jgi:ribosome-associated protein
VSVPDDASGVVRVTPSLGIPVSELQFRFSPSGGPGGQHANKVSTRVELRQRARLLDRLGPEIRVVADDERSQIRNRAVAVDRFRARVADALRVEKPRRPTRPSRGAKERRLADKRRLSERKRDRRPDLED